MSPEKSSACWNCSSFVMNSLSPSSRVRTVTSVKCHCTPSCVMSCEYTLTESM